MLDGKMVFPVVGQALVEHAILLGCDVTRIASPDGIHLVEFLTQGLSLLSNPNPAAITMPLHWDHTQCQHCLAQLKMINHRVLTVVEEGLM